MSENPGKTRLLAISPHLDDAVLSFGASLAQAAQDGAEVTVFTVFAGISKPPYSPVAERLHASWGLSPDQDATLYRRNEDSAALRHLGVRYRHGRFLDAIYRKSQDGRWLVGGGQRAIIGPHFPESDAGLISEIKDDINSVIKEYYPTLLVTCAALGGHVDHKMTRDSALLAANEKNIPIRLWEDLPYAADVPSVSELPEGFLLGPPSLNFVKQDIRVRKFQAIELYVSQLSMLDGANKNLFSKLAEHGRQAPLPDGYGETTWPVFSRGDSGDFSGLATDSGHRAP